MFGSVVIAGGILFLMSEGNGGLGHDPGPSLKVLMRLPLWRR